MEKQGAGHWHPLQPAVFLIVVLSAAIVLQGQSDQADRVRESGTVLDEIMAAPDGGIPKSVLDKAEGIAVFPSMLRGGFIFGGMRGRGILSVRDPRSHRWSPPAFLTLTGGSFGAQIGGQAIDLILVIQNRRGLEQLVSNSFKLGAGASVAAGPVGRDAAAATDVQMRAEILSYSRSRGLFAGILVDGSTIRQDTDSNRSYYGQAFRTRDIVFDGKATAPASTAIWLDSLARHAG